MSTLTEQVANLVTSTDNLTTEVINKIGQINGELNAKKTEIDGYWSAKSAAIDADWLNKANEINQRLSDFDNLVFHAKPAKVGTGDGLSVANATTLKDIIENKLVNSVVNIVYVSPGLHVLTSGTTINNCYVVKFLPEGTYDALNPPIIVTPSTTDSNISRDVVGNPSPSQTCPAHHSDEYPLLVNNSMVVFENIRFRGTRHALRLEKSTAIISGETYFDVWVFSISCTAHRGVGLYCADSKVYGSGQWHINIYHPDYTACTDAVNDYAAPMVCERSEVLLFGRLEWISNILVAKLPTESIAEYRITVDSSPKTCINSRDRSFIRIQNFAYKGCRQLFYASGFSVIDIQYIERLTGSEPIQWIGQVFDHSKILLTNQFSNWPTNQQNKLNVQNAGNVADNGSIIAYLKSAIFLKGVEIIATCACSTFVVLDKDSELHVENSTISADSRTGNLGFFKALQSYSSRAFLKGNAITTRNGDSDVAITTETGQTISISNTFVATTIHKESNFGRFIDNGIVHGNITFNTEKVFSVPGDFNTLQDAINFLGDKRWSDDVMVYIDLQAGVHSFDSAIAITNKNSLGIRGVTPLVKTVTSLVSTSGSSGNYSVVLQLGNTTGLQVNQYLNVESNRVVYLDSGLLGTGLPNALAGCHKITAISGNNVTLNVKYVGTLPALTITGGWVVFCPTQLKFTSYTGLLISNSSVTLANIGIIGNNVTGWWASTAGIIVSANSELKASKIGLAEFRSGLLSLYSARITITTGCFSGNEIGILAAFGGVIEAYSCAFIGNSKGGVYAGAQGNITVGEFPALGNGLMDVYAVNAGNIFTTNAQATNVSPAGGVVGNGNSAIVSVSSLF